ncbi:MAG: hypothetical protein ACRDOK_02615 [Streptosporangiaceae bacterium]
MSDATPESQPPLPEELASPKAAAARIAELTAENEALKAAAKANPGDVILAPPPAGTVRMRVRPPHSSMHYGGVTVGQDWTDVPASYETRLQTAAQESGVELEQEA